MFSNSRVFSGTNGLRKEFQNAESFPELDRRPSDSFHSDVSTGPRAGAADGRADACSSRSPEFFEPKGCGRVLPEAVSGVDHQDNLQRLRGGQDGQRLLAFHEGQHTASDGADRAPNFGVAFRLEYAGLAQIQRRVPREGPENRSDVGRRRRQARRHVERYITRTANAGADPRNASQGYEADAGGRLWISPGPGRRDD